MEVLNNIAKQFLTDANADGKVDAADVVGSLKNLLADTSGKLDFNSLLTKFKDAGISETVASWLGDGKNAELSVDKLTSLFDAEKLNQFAASLNIDVETAKTALSNAIPNLIDQVSSGGNLLDNIGEQAAKLQAEVSEIADTVKSAAAEKSEGLFAKIKKLLG